MAGTDELTTIVSTKGQVILPKAIRRQRHWDAGTKLVVEDREDGVLLRAAPLFARSSIDAVFGSLAYPGKAKSIEEMHAAVAAEAQRRARD